MAAGILVGPVAAIHFSILVLEMFPWRTDRVRATFGTSEKPAEQAANQVYGLISDDLTFQVFLLSCVIVAGIYGALTATRRILFAQVIPAGAACQRSCRRLRSRLACTQSATWQVEW